MTGDNRTDLFWETHTGHEETAVSTTPSAVEFIDTILRELDSWTIQVASFLCIATEGERKEERSCTGGVSLWLDQLNSVRDS